MRITLLVAETVCLRYTGARVILSDSEGPLASDRQGPVTLEEAFNLWEN